MMSQIQPHFIYNTLGSISSLCEEDPLKARDVTDRFAMYLRVNMTKALGRLRNPVCISKRVKICCFGNFEAYCDGEPIQFNLTKTSELLAYLVDRNGAECRAHEIIAALFEDDNNREYYKKLRHDLLQTFEELDISDCLFVTRGGLCIRRENVECDYFDYKDGRITAPPNEYMTQYSFGEITFAGMMNNDQDF